MPPDKPPRVRVERGLHKQGDTWYASATPPGQRRERFKSLGRGFGITKARTLRDAAVAEIRAAGPARTDGDLDQHATFGRVADAWLEGKRRRVQAGKLGPRTVKDSYEPAVRLHLKPWFELNRPKLRHLTAQDLLAWHGDQLDAGAADWSIKARWIALTGILSYAVRRGVIATNPADTLEPGERPGAGANRQRFLDEDEMRRLIVAAHTKRWRLLIAVNLFAGLRISEALGLRWEDLDFDERTIRVRHQLSRQGDLVELKTDAGRRDVVMMDALAAVAREHKLAAGHSLDGHPVFATASGRAVTQRNATREFTRAVGYSGLDRVTAHALRHTFASILIHKGKDPAWVADQLGHADPSITLRVYAKLFRSAKQRDDTRRELDAEYGHLLREAM